MSLLNSTLSMASRKSARLLLQPSTSKPEESIAQIRELQAVITALCNEAGPLQKELAEKTAQIEELQCIIATLREEASTLQLRMSQEKNDSLAALEITSRRLMAAENQLYTIQGHFARRGQPRMMSPNTHEQARDKP
jgi:chromosome segregation ATPase